VPATAYAVIVDPQGVRERLPARASRRSGWRRRPRSAPGAQITARLQNDESGQW